jgi:hypothetical protein
MGVPSDYGCEYAYFFTTIDNIASICQIGQYSRRKTKEYHKKGYITWNDAALKKNLINNRSSYDDYATLFWGTHTNTQERWETEGIEFAFIRYNADQLFTMKDSKFSNCALQLAHDSRYTGVWPCNSHSQNLSMIKWDIINRKQRETWFDYWSRSHGMGPHKQAELLVKDCIPCNFIHDIIVFSESMKEKMEQAIVEKYKLPNLFLEGCCNDFSPQVSINQDLFFKPYCMTCGDGEDVEFRTNGGHCNYCEHDLNDKGECIARD